MKNSLQLTRNQEVVMTSLASKTKDKSATTFIPKMVNFETSLRYEGLSVKKENMGKSIYELTLKYAR